VLFSFKLFAQDLSKFDSLVSKMTYEEKIIQLSGCKSKSAFMFKMIWGFVKGENFALIQSGENKRLGINSLSFTDGPRGVVVGKKNTCFPVALARGASFDIDLERKVAAAIATEAQAQGANYFAGLCVNLIRHPSGGRAQESYGEDPFHVGEMGLAMCTEVQRNGIMACVKHFAFNNSEENRYNANVNMSDRTMHEVYLPHFRKIVQQGKVASVMSAYNKFRGNFCGENSFLLHDVLRKQWGFSGFVSSDWEWGLRNGPKGISAGMNIEMGYRNHYGKELRKAIDNNQISIEQINQLVSQVIAMKSRFGSFKKRKLSDEEKLAHKTLAREAAEQSMVLLKNEGVLPLSNPINSILITGPLAKSNNMGDVGSSKVKARSHSTPYDGLREICKVKGIKLHYSNGKNIDKTLQLARKVDAVVTCIGFSSKDEGEWIMKNPDKGKFYPIRFSGGDRGHLSLSQSQETLIKSIHQANKKNITVFFGAGAPHVKPWVDSCQALLFAFYPGMEGGNALANLIFGNVNPSGKLPYSIYSNPTDYPEFFYRNDSLFYDYYHGYALADKKNLPVEFPFGYGLSYSNFEIGNPHIQLENDTIKITTIAKNIGKVSGAEVLQVYVDFSESAIDRPVKSLKAFAKVYLHPNESKEVTMKIPLNELAYYNEKSNSFVIEKVNYGITVSNSLNTLNLASYDLKLKE
jgi:beta-glucosidase